MTEETKPAVRPITVVICTPCHGEVKTGMAWSVANAMAHFLMVPYEAELRCAWEIMGGSNLAQQRQQLVSRAMQLQATHVLFWDSDIKAPADLIPRMLNHSKPIVCANYPTKELVSRPTVYLDGDERTGPLWTKAGDDELVGDVARAGTGLMLIDTETFYRIELPWFHFKPREPDFVHIGGEDHYFCDKVRAVGIPIFCDQAISNEVAHIGNFEYTNEWAIRAEEARQAIYNGEYDEASGSPEPRKRNWTPDENAKFKTALADTMVKREAAE